MNGLHGTKLLVDASHAVETASEPLLTTRIVIARARSSSSFGGSLEPRFDSSCGLRDKSGGFRKPASKIRFEGLLVHVAGFLFADDFSENARSFSMGVEELSSGLDETIRAVQPLLVASMGVHGSTTIREHAIVIGPLIVVNLGAI